MLLLKKMSKKQASDKNNLNNSDLKICLEITQELSKMPGASPFNEPIKPTANEYAEYRRLIKNPQDLGTIAKKLENGEYSNVQAWEKDMNLIWSNAETFNGKDAYVTTIARHMAKHCEKLKKRLSMRKISGWMKCLYIWREKLDKLMVSPPNDSKLRIFPIPTYVKPEYKPFTDREFDIFLEATRTLNKSEDIKQLSKITQQDPNYTPTGDNMIVDVDQLETRTLYALRNYVMKRYNEMGIPYPE